jgi:hypothetical protein
MLPMPRPVMEPISAWVNGLFGRPVDMLGSLTLVPGNNGAARLISGAAVCHPPGIDKPPNRCADASWAETEDPNDRSWPATPLIPSCNLPSTSCETLPSSAWLLARVAWLACIELLMLINILAGMLPNIAA